MFNEDNSVKLARWKQFRDALETSTCPFEDVAEFWSHAPFVSDFLDPANSSNWPDPWHLILDSKFDDLAITVGMLYTLQLTNKFKECYFEIHMLEDSQIKPSRYWLVVNKNYALNYHYKQVVTVDQINEKSIIILHTNTSLL